LREALEELRTELNRDSCALIRHSQTGELAIPLGGYLHRSILGGVLDRIGKKVGDGLLKADRVSEQGQGFGSRMEVKFNVRGEPKGAISLDGLSR
jgi:hypothetical protein